MSDLPPTLRHRNLPLLLLQTRERMLARFRPVFNVHGLTDQQWRILRALHDGALEPRELGHICCISSPSMAGVLARMDEMGLVSRERMAHDQRRVSVSLTPRSRKLLSQMTPQIEETYRSLEAELGVDAIAQLYAQLDAVLQRLEGDNDQAEAA